MPREAARDGSHWQVDQGKRRHRFGVEKVGIRLVLQSTGKQVYRVQRLLNDAAGASVEMLLLLYGCGDQLSELDRNNLT